MFATQTLRSVWLAWMVTPELPSDARAPLVVRPPQAVIDREPTGVGSSLGATACDHQGGGDDG
jgi:hypothetical protein